jgi:hypothetical protein
MTAVETAPEGVDPETGEIEKSTTVDSRPVVLMSVDEAEVLTAKIISYGGSLLNLLHEAHDKGAWKVLGYKSFVAYVNDRLGYGKARAYQLLAYIVVTEQLALAAELDVAEVRDFVTERATRGIDATTAAEQVKAKADALPDDATPADREQIVHETVEQHKTKTTVTKPSAGAPPLPPADAPADPSLDESNHADPPEPDGGERTEAEPPPAPAPDPAAVRSLEGERAMVSGRARDMRRFLALEPARVARVIDPKDWATYLSLADELEQYAAGLRAALTPQIGAVK